MIGVWKQILQIANRYFRIIVDLSLFLLLHWNTWVESDRSSVERLLRSYSKVIVKFETIFVLLLRLDLNEIRVLVCYSTEILTIYIVELWLRL